MAFLARLRGCSTSCRPAPLFCGLQKAPRVLFHPLHARQVRAAAAGALEERADLRSQSWGDLPGALLVMDFPSDDSMYQELMQVWAARGWSAASQLSRWQRNFKRLSVMPQ